MNVRDIKTDPNDANKILVATDDGFYMSTNGGTSFNLIDLPNATALPTREGTWQIVYIGQVGGVSQWVVSGVYACPGANPPSIQGGSFACGADTAHYNMGDFWKSTDAGASWTHVLGGGGGTRDVRFNPADGAKAIAGDD